MPIWLTEYGLINFAGAPSTRAEPRRPFITAATTGMESQLSFERYAWFALPAVADSVGLGLYRDGSTPTEAGKAYRAAG